MDYSAKLFLRVVFDNRSRNLNPDSTCSFDSLCPGFTPVTFELLHRRRVGPPKLVGSKTLPLRSFSPVSSNKPSKAPPPYWPSFRLGPVEVRTLLLTFSPSSAQLLLHSAVFRNDVVLIRALVTKPQLIRDLFASRDGSWHTPLDVACLLARYEVALEFLVHFYELNQRQVLFACPHNPSQRTVLHHAILGGTQTLAALIVNCFGHEQDGDLALKDACDAQGNTPLHLACVHNQIEVCRALIEVDADCNARNLGGDTPLTLALKQPHYLTIAPLLFTSAAPPRADVANVQLETPLYLLAKHGHSGSADAALARTLLAHGAVPGHTLADGTSCLHMAASRGCLVFCQVILEWHRNKTSNIIPADFRGSATALSFFLPVYRNPQGLTASQLASTSWPDLAALLAEAEQAVPRSRGPGLPLLWDDKDDAQLDTLS